MSDEQARVDPNTHTPPLRPSEGPTAAPTWYLAVYAALHRHNPKLAAEALERYQQTSEEPEQ